MALGWEGDMAKKLTVEQAVAIMHSGASAILKRHFSNICLRKKKDAWVVIGGEIVQ